MAENPLKRNPFAFNLRGNLIAGVLALAPLAAAWLVLRVLLDILFDVGQPLAEPVVNAINAGTPSLAPALSNPIVHEVIAIVSALAVIYVVGFVTSRVIGRRVMGLVEQIISRIPLVETIYSAVKKLVGVIQRHPGQASRVVLLEFPHPGVRAIGLLTRTFKDAKTGEELAAVLVPTAPNPTTGYLQLVKTQDLTPTDMSLDEAMSMIISGGANAPEGLTLERS